MVETKLHPQHPSTMEARIHARKRNSGDVKHADVVTQDGTSAQRVFHNIHNPGSARRHGSPNEGEGSIDGNKRGTV